MKTLSIKQPWAWLIASGIKDVENRTWRTNYRGRIYVHASGRWDSQWLNIFPKNEFENIEMPDFLLKNYSQFAIIGEVDIIDCIKDSISVWAQEGCWHWLLKNPILYDTPILNVKGKLSLWEY